MNLDDKVQEAQDYLRSLSEGGDYLEYIADELLPELYALSILDKPSRGRTSKYIKEQQAVEAKTMKSRYELWASNGFQRAGQSSPAKDSKK